MADGQIVGTRVFSGRDPASRSYGGGFRTIQNPNTGGSQVVPELRDPGSGGGGSGGGGSSGSGGFPSEITTRQEIVIPDFLKPMIEAQHQRQVIGNEALKSLRSFINKGDLVAPLNEDQLAALDMARGVAQGPDLQRAIETAKQTAFGEDPALAQGRSGVEFLQGMLSGNAGPLPTGSEEFRNAFEASLRQINPRIRSQFALSGRTGSGLSQVAREQAANDAFANLFNRQRDRQVRSASALTNLFNTERGRQLNTLQNLPNFLLQPSRITSNVGDVLQNQAQRERAVPLQARQSLAATAAGTATPVNIGSLTGTTTTQPNLPTPLIQNLQAAGIDPQSDEGRDIITNALNPQQQGGGGPSTLQTLIGGLGIIGGFL